MTSTEIEHLDLAHDEEDPHFFIERPGDFVDAAEMPIYVGDRMVFSNIEITRVAKDTYEIRIGER